VTVFPVVKHKLAGVWAETDRHIRLQCYQKVADGH